jgi:N-acetylneuraminic acid mutarotase
MRSIAVLTSFFALVVSAQDWVQLPDFPGMARDDAASFTVGGTIHVGTGMDVGFQYTNDWHAYDAASESWGSMASLPASGRQYCAAFAVDGKGYLFGGIDANGALNELWMYDPQTDAWTARTALPEQGRYASTAYAYNGFGYVHGGIRTDGSVTDELWLYTPGTDTWTLLDFPLLQPLPALHRATIVHHVGFRFIVGGMNGQDEPMSATYMHTDNGYSFMEFATLPAPRFGARGAAHVFIGGASSFTQEHDDVWFFQAQTGWDPFVLLPFAGGPRRGGIAAEVLDGNMYDVYFGLGLHNGERFSDWWKLTVPLGIEEARGNTIRTYPNPASTYIELELPEQGGRLTYWVCDAIGKRVLEGHTADRTVVDITSLGPGRYTMVVFLQDRPYHGSFIKLP